MNKVPIGKQLSTSALVLVQEVLAGKACGCICHSCGMELIARQGQKNIWHFAHIRSEGAHAIELCDYSAEISVRDLVLQEAASIIEFTTPDFRYTKSGYQPYLVTTTKILSVDSVKCRVKSEAGVSDIVLSVQGYRLHVLLRAAGQPLGFDVSKVKTDGVLRVSISSLLSRIERNELADKSRFIELVCNGTAPMKSWVYHPRLPSRDKLTPLKINYPEVKANFRPHHQLWEQAKPTVPKPILIPQKPVLKPPKTELTKHDLLGLKAKCGYLKQSAYHCKKCGHISYSASELKIDSCQKCQESSKGMFWKVT